MAKKNKKQAKTAAGKVAMTVGISDDFRLGAHLMDLYHREQMMTLKANGAFAEFLSKQSSRRIYRELSDYKPTDEIRLTVKMIDELVQLWGSNLKDFKSGHVPDGIPTDILWAGTVPIMDMVNKTGIVSNDTRCSTDEGRVLIYPDYKARLEKLQPGETAEVGIVSIKFRHESFEYASKICINGDEPNIFYFWDIYATRGKMRPGAYLTANGAEGLILQYLGMWYGIQLALLHPLMETSFIEYSDEEIAEVQKKMGIITKTQTPAKAQKERPIKDGTKIRKRYISEETWEEVLRTGISQTRGNYQRHKLLWRVRGYRRQNGTFVKGHWRGPLRDAVANPKLKAPRQREIVRKTDTDNE